MADEPTYIGTEKAETLREAAEAAMELDELEKQLDEACASLDRQLKLKGVDLSTTNFALTSAFDTLMTVLFQTPEQQREFALRHMAVMAAQMEEMLRGAE